LDDQQAAVLAASANSTVNADSDGTSKIHRIQKATTNQQQQKLKYR